MKTIPTLFDLRSLITAENAERVALNPHRNDLNLLLAELNRELCNSGEKPLDSLYALPLLQNALKRLHQIHEKKRLAFAALEIARNLLKDFAYDAISSQEDGESLCDTVTDWSVIWPNEGIDVDAQDAARVVERLDEVL